MKDLIEDRLKQFDEKFSYDNGYICPDWLRYDSLCEHDDAFFCEHRQLAVKNFLRQSLLSYQDKVIEEIDKAWDKKENELHGGYDDAEYLHAYEMALSDIKQAIKNIK